MELHHNGYWSIDSLYLHEIQFRRPMIQYRNTSFNTLRPRQNDRNFADDTFKRIFLNENVGISIKLSLKFVPKGPINNIPALVQVMAWCPPGDKPLYEPMMVSLLMHICITQPQWFNTLRPRQNGWHFADNIFKILYLNENSCILLQVSLRLRKVPLDNKPPLVK